MSVVCIRNSPWISMVGGGIRFPWTHLAAGGNADYTWKDNAWSVDYRKVYLIKILHSSVSLCSACLLMNRIICWTNFCTCCLMLSMRVRLLALLHRTAYTLAVILYAGVPIVHWHTFSSICPVGMLQLWRLCIAVSRSKNYAVSVYYAELSTSTTLFGYTLWKLAISSCWCT